ncbi:TonB-dependent receptor plug domain-containing protein [Myroides injenensis]|nr:TonB-dependent receptor plug domain-containing protein [Myroides injenensis]
MNKNTLLLSILFFQGVCFVKAQTNDSLAIKTQELQEVTIKAVGNSFTKKKSSNSLRLSQTVNNLPQNIQVLTADLIEGRHITTIDQGVVRNVSGAVRLEEWGDVYARINMRGSRASAFRNGMNISSVYGPLSEDMSFVESIEFVKGPAGFMMSNGEPSGIYNVVTKKPTG